MALVELTKERHEQAHCVIDLKNEVTRSLRGRYGAGYSPRRNNEGIHGEAMVAQFLGLDWDSAASLAGGHDVGPYQVRATSHVGSGRLLIHPEDKHAAYILVHLIDCWHGEVVGWLWRDDAMREEWWQELQKDRPAFVVPLDALLPMSSLPQYNIDWCPHDGCIQILWWNRPCPEHGAILSA